LMMIWSAGVLLEPSEVPFSRCTQRPCLQ
jgi:hypothetical protein